MKAKYVLFLTLFFAVAVTSCFSGSGSVLTRATGFAYEIIVVMDKAHWNNEVGKSVKSELWAPIPGLPQHEPSFKITAVNHNEFNGLLTYVRNILLVRIDDKMYTKVSVSTENNKWASGQDVMLITSPDADSLMKWIEENPRYITNYFTRVEMARAAQQMEKTYSSLVMDYANTMFDISIKVPADMSSSKQAEHFLWASNNANTGRMDVLVYSFPYTDPNTFTADYLVAKRDSVLKENLPGAFPDSYMTTETRFEPIYTPITVRGKYVGELRGLWKMVGDMMGGPFISHVRLDEQNNRIIVVEGFVYAPETNKGNFIRRLESSLYTLRLPGDAE